MLARRVVLFLLYLDFSLLTEVSQVARKWEKGERPLPPPPQILWCTVIHNFGWNQTSFETPVFHNPGNAPIVHVQIFGLLESLGAHVENRFAEVTFHVTKLSFIAMRHQHILNRILAGGRQRSLSSLSFSRCLRHLCQQGIWICVYSAVVCEPAFTLWNSYMTDETESNSSRKKMFQEYLIV